MLDNWETVCERAGCCKIEVKEEETEASDALWSYAVQRKQDDRSAVLENGRICKSFQCTTSNEHLLRCNTLEHSYVLQMF